MKNCENCDQGHIGEYGSGRFCSSKCARGFSTKSKRKEINEKIREALKKKGNPKIKKKCKLCKRNFEIQWSKRHQIFCSVSCSTKFKWNIPEYRNNIIDSINEKVKNGDWAGWAYRGRVEPSYAEKFMMSILDKHEIEYEYQYKINRFFVDFAFIDRRLILEIDGSQHLSKQHKEKDKSRDKILETKEDWKVYRIAWKGVNNSSKKNYMELEIDKFLDFYRKMVP